MSKKGYFLVFIILISIQALKAQKRVQKTIFDTKDTAIEINANDCFLVTIKTAKNNTILVEAKMEGEYGEELLLNLYEEGKTLLINTAFNPMFSLPNDKLGAHKALSISLQITIPENMKVQLYGTYCNVDATGIYQKISIALNDGNCVLKDIKDKATVHTQSGAIALYTKSGTVSAISKYGKVISDDILAGNQQYQLNSITGNIHIYKTE
jgi:hypothetical protein